MTPFSQLDFAGLRAWGASVVPSALFWTVSGAHLYGFESVDSDIDLRGCFRLPPRALLGLRAPADTVEPQAEVDGTLVEAVSHEVGKYLRLLAKSNGYVLEQILSPLVVDGEDFLAELRPLARRFVTRTCYHHYRGFLRTRRRVLEKEEPTKAKSLLYAYRVALTGIHLLRTGEVQPHLPTLNEGLKLAFVPDLIARKRAAEVVRLPDMDAGFHVAELDRLQAELDRAFEESTLPEVGPLDELNEFLVATRLGG